MHTLGRIALVASLSILGVATAAPAADLDGDGVDDSTDLCPAIADPDQADGDGDGRGDLCDIELETALASLLVDTPNGFWSSPRVDGDLVAVEYDLFHPSFGRAPSYGIFQRGDGGWSGERDFLGFGSMSRLRAVSERRLFVAQPLDPNEGGGELEIFGPPAPDGAIWELSQRERGVFSGRQTTLSVDGDRMLTASGTVFSSPVSKVLLWQRDAGGTWQLATTLVGADDPQAGLGAIGSGGALSGARAVTALSPEGPLWTFEEKPAGTWSRGPDLEAPEGTTWTDVSSLDLSGDVLVVPLPGDDGAALGAGAVQVFERSEEGWTLRETLHAPDAGAGDAFGADLVLVGELLVVGAPGVDRGESDQGAAYVFVDLAGSFRLVDRLEPAATAGARYGAHLSSDGATVVLGAWSEADETRAAVVYALPWVCRDADGDGYGSPITPSCVEPRRDCADDDAAVNPGAVEIPGNGVDDDCDPITPIGCGEALD